MHPLLILGIGITIVIGMIVVLRINAFIALTSAALVVSMLAPGPLAEKDADTVALEGDLSANLGMKVKIDHHSGKESGQLTISYRTLDELDVLCNMLTRS